tara:strand:- start:141 stop:521 length:381 start_codon:yes stop_codon:yes gene_type:complete
MKAVMIGLALFLVMGCGRSDAKKLSEELDARNKAWEAEVEALSNARPNESTKPEPTKAKTGVKLWEFETGSGVFSSPAIGPDGTVYVGSYDKKLYAIKTNSKGLAKSPWPMRGQNARHTGRALKKE